MMTQTQELQIESELTTAHHSFEKGLNLYAYFKIHDHTISEELVQEAFLKTWAYMIKGGNIEMMKAFLYHILNDLVVDEYRKHKTSSLDALLEKGYEPRVINSGQMINFLEGTSASLLIRRLPEKYKKVMMMRYIKELSLNEISLITGQSKNTVAVQVHRGLEKLKLLYNPQKLCFGHLL